VRGALSGEGEQLESNDSNRVVLTPKDIFPPSAPQGVVAAALPATTLKLLVDLSWSINVETDVAGYRVYRSEKQGERGSLITNELLLTPAYQDLTVANGQHYWYTVTAVDRAGNESAPSEQIAIEIPQPSN
jgi:fibronectin type 3 domain-containing protein